MNIQHVFLVALAIAGFVLSGCANESATTAAPRTDLTEKRVYTQEELQKTGQPETGPALEKVDPSVRTSHP